MFRVKLMGSEDPNRTLEKLVDSTDESQAIALASENGWIVISATPEEQSESGKTSEKAKNWR